MPTPPLPAHILNAAPNLWAQAGQPHWVPVHGQSMLPFLRPGDEVWVVPNPAVLRRGDVVVLQTPAGLLVHRLLCAEPWSRPRLLRTHGDNNRFPDPPARAENLLGQVRTVRRPPGTLNLDTVRRRASGWLIASGLIAVNHLASLPRPWSLPGRLTAGAAWRCLRLFCVVAGR